MMAGAPPFQGFSFAAPPPPQASSAAAPSAQQASSFAQPPPQPAPAVAPPPPFSVAAPAVVPKTPKHIPIEAFKREGEDTDTWSHWWKVKVQGARTIANSYQCLAEACDCPGKVSELRKWATIQRLHPNCQLYPYISDYVKNSRIGYLRIKQIYKIDRKGERGPFTEPHRFMFWYGARPSSVPAILQSGFEAARVGGTISFADRLGRSQQFATENSKGRYLFVLAEVAPGRIYETTDKTEDLSAPPQDFDSIMTAARFVPDWTREAVTYNGMAIPCGPTVRNQFLLTSDFAYNDFILNDANRAIVRFVVECSRV